MCRVDPHCTNGFLLTAMLSQCQALRLLSGPFALSRCPLLIFVSARTRVFLSITSALEAIDGTLKISTLTGLVCIVLAVFGVNALCADPA